LGFDRLQDERFPLGQGAELADPLLDGQHLFWIKPSRLVFAKPGNEWDRVAGIEQLNGVLDFFRGELEVARDDNNIFGHKFPNQTRMAAVVNCHIEAAITQLPVGFNRRYSPVSVRQREKSVAGRGQRQVEK
jgi:hypothetical protein